LLSVGFICRFLPIKLFLNPVFPNRRWNYIRPMINRGGSFTDRLALHIFGFPLPK